MYRRDYILKMIEEFARAIGVAFGLKHEGRDAEALNELRGAYKTWCALDSDTFTAMTPQQFLDLLLTEKQFSVQQIKALADGLKAEADILDANSLLEKRDRLSKALFLLEYVEMTDTGTFDPTRMKMINALKEELVGLD